MLKQLYDMNWADSKSCTCCQAAGTENTDCSTAATREKIQTMPDVVTPSQTKAKLGKRGVGMAERACLGSEVQHMMGK